MTSGPGRPGQPMPGQRSIFGTGRGPVFAQMPAYKPVTRGSEPQPQAPEPPQPDFGAYARQGVEPGVSGYANQNGASSYQTPSAPPRSYTTPDFPNPFPPQQTYQPQPQSYQPQPQQNYQPQQSYQPQPQQSYPGRATSRSRPARATSRSLQAQPKPNSGPAVVPARATLALLPGCGLPRPDLPGRSHATRWLMPSRRYDDTNYAERELSATHPSKMRASPTPPSRMQVSPRRRPSRITLKRPRITTPLACMTPCISTMRPLPTAPNPIRSCSPINQDTIIRPGTIIFRRPRIPRRRASRVLCRRIRPCKPSMPSTISRRRSR